MTPDDLDRKLALIERFAALHPEYGDPRIARGSCRLATRQFVEMAKAAGVEASAAFSLGGPEGNHCTVNVGEYSVDFTARQFNRDAPFPLIVRRERT